MARVDSATPPSYDPDCALCPGNARLQGVNPAYTGTYWFPNDLPTFGSPDPPSPGDSLYRTKAATGTAEVIVYHPDHGKTFARLTRAEAISVVTLWRDRTRALKSRPDIDQILIFENKGAQVGTSNPHPHGQLYAGNLVYGIIAREAEVSRRHFETTGRLLGMDVAEREGNSPRVIAENSRFLATLPWFARYAYEVLILPKRPVADLTELDEEEIPALGELLREVTIRYDNLWKMPMPYVMAIHQAPCDGRDPRAYPFHIEFHPPLRKPDTLKYLAGPEIGGGSMTNETDPDQKAAELKAVSALHYLDHPHA